MMSTLEQAAVALNTIGASTGVIFSPENSYSHRMWHTLMSAS